MSELPEGTGVRNLGPELDFLHIQFNNFIVTWDTPSVRKKLAALGYPGAHDHVDLPPEVVMELALDMEESWKQMPKDHRRVLQSVKNTLRALGYQLDSYPLAPILARLGCQSRKDFNIAKFRQLQSELLILLAEKEAQCLEEKALPSNRRPPPPKPQEQFLPPLQTEPMKS